MKKEPIILYHCPYCDYEAGRRSFVVEHIKHKHEDE